MSDSRLSCLNCGTRFSRYNFYQKFCSSKCRHRWRHKYDRYVKAKKKEQARLIDKIEAGIIKMVSA